MNQTPAYDSSTRLYALGSNGSGQLGVLHKDDVWSPEVCHFSIVNEDNSTHVTAIPPFTSGETIYKIAAGGNHTLLLTTAGRLFTTGANNSGQSLLDNEEAESTSFREYSSIRESFSTGRRVTDIAATWEASFVVLDGKEIYVSGSGTKGELGLGHGMVSTSPTGIQKCFDIADSDAHPRIDKLTACMSHVIVVDSAGRIYGWGSSRKGELGDRFRASKVVWEPQRLETGAFAVAQAITGKDFTFVLGTNGEEMMLGETKHFSTPVLKTDLDATITARPQVYAGWSFILALDSDGSVTGCGRNHKNQMPKLGEKRVKMLAVGSEHSIALSADGELLVWGWGEHGNCGKPVNERGHVTDTFNVIAFSNKDGSAAKEFVRVEVLGAGCATSFFGLAS